MDGLRSTAGESESMADSDSAAKLGSESAPASSLCRFFTDMRKRDWGLEVGGRR